jgi:hypothetical protein
MRTDNAADIRLDAMLENCIFYISWMYEFSHSLGQKRTNYRGLKPTFVRYCSNSGQTRVRLDCPLSANRDQRTAAISISIQ